MRKFADKVLILMIYFTLISVQLMYWHYPQNVQQKCYKRKPYKKIVNERYAGWNSELGQHILQGKTSLETLAQLVQQKI